MEAVVAPEWVYNLPKNTQAKRNQYGLKHYVTGTIYETIGGTLISIAAETSQSNGNFKYGIKVK